MANSNGDSLQIDEDDTQDGADLDLFSEDDWDEESPSDKKKQALLNDRKRGKIRRSIEEIKERKRLMELLGDDFDELDYLDS